MSFQPISMKKYIRIHLQSNPSHDEAMVRESLESALDCFAKGVKCNCGNDIWVIGSAFVGNSCFTCITGESDPSEDYEIKEALPKSMG